MPRNSSGPTSRPRLLLIRPSTFEAEFEKRGYASYVALNRMEALNGYFEKVYCIKFFGEKRHVWHLDHRVAMIQFERFFPWLAPFPPIRKALSLLAYLILIRRIARTRRVTVIRATDPFYRGLVGSLLKLVTGLPFVVSLHSDYDKYEELSNAHDYDFFGSRRTRDAVTRWILRRADRVFCISRYIGAYAIRKGADPAAIRITYHGVDVPVLPEKDPARVDPFTIVFVGRIHRENHIGSIIDIVRRVRDRGCSVTFELIGSGPDEDWFRREVVTAGLESSIHLLGRMDLPAINRHLATRLFSFCPISGYVLIEAALASQCVLSYDIEWHAELIEDGRDGVLVREGDCESLAERFIELSACPARAIAMGRLACAKAIAQHERGRVCDQKKAAYDELLKK